MIYSQEVSNMTCVAKGIEKHGTAGVERGARDRDTSRASGISTRIVFLQPVFLGSAFL